MPAIDLNARSQEILVNFPAPHGRIKLDDRGEPDMAAYLAAIMSKLTAGYAAKYAKQKHSDWAEHLEDEILITEAYIGLLHFAGTFNLILDNKKIAGKNRGTIGGQIVDLVNTMSKIGKNNAVISDHSLTASALNQLLVYADRNSYEVEDVYQKMLAAVQSQTNGEQRLAG